MDLAAFTEVVSNLVRDIDGQLEVADIDTAVTLATNRYNKDRPNELIEDVTAPATTTLNLPASWVSGFSEVKGIEYPLDQTRPSYLEPNSYILYEGPGNVETIKLVDCSVVLASTSRITFTAKHDSPDTFADEDIELVASFGAAHLCEQLAAAYGHSADATIQSDSVDHVNKGRDFAIRAKSLRAAYANKFKPRTSSAAASAVATVTKKNSGGGSRMYH